MPQESNVSGGFSLLHIVLTSGVVGAFTAYSLAWLLPLGKAVASYAPTLLFFATVLGGAIGVGLSLWRYGMSKA